MSRKVQLTVVAPLDDDEVPSVMTDVTPDRICAACAGRTVERAEGTIYCCDAAELSALRELRSELLRHLMVEIESGSPVDVTTSRLLGFLFKKVRRAKAL